MTTLGKTGWIVSLILAIALGGVLYVFLIRGSVVPYADGRTSVLLAPNERNKVLGEMRGLLEGVQQIVEASVQGDMETVTVVASSLGMAAASGEDPQMIRKLPLEFKTLGMATHAAFDDLADTARVGSADDVLQELSVLMLNCTACHGGYRLGVEGEEGLK